MEEQQLKRLQTIQVSEERKRQDFVQISERLKKKTLINWQIPAVISAIAAILLFLVLTNEQALQIEQTSAEVMNVKKLEMSDNSHVPHSIWYPGVLSIKDELSVRSLEQWISEAVWEKVNVEKVSNSFLNLAITDENGVKRFFFYDSTSKSEMLVERETGYAFIAREENELQLYNLLNAMYDEAEWPSYFIFLPMIFFIFMAFDEKSRKKITGDQNRLPFHSTIWQSVSTITLYSGLFLILLIMQYQVHYFIVIATMLINLLVCIVLEQNNENNRWRIRNFVYQTLFLMSYFYIGVYN